MTIVGVSGGSRNAMAVLAEGGRLVGGCLQERVTRVRGAGVNASGMPDEAVDLLLARSGRTRAEVDRFVTAGCTVSDADRADPEQVDEQLAYACTAYLTSGFPSAAIVVCDGARPGISLWRGDGAAIEPAGWSWPEARFVEVFLRAAAGLGFPSNAGVPRVEALARLHPGWHDPEIDALFSLADGVVSADPSLERHIADRLAGDRHAGSPLRPRLAAAVQSRLGDLLIELLGDVRTRLGQSNLCLGGNLFHHSYVNTRVRQSGLFDRVFVPVDPGQGGLAVGATLRALGQPPSLVSPFLGPAYDPQEMKDTLDNCKLQYSWESEEGSVQAAVAALQQGRLVGWFDGPMEWGPRALGARCILASPTAPYVLENLNRFLKRREPWRGYALSGLEASVAEHFDGPDAAPFMECDYQPRDRERFQHILPSPDAAVRVHTVSADGSLPRFRRLLEACGEATGLPILVNTSFNGFHEPIVCSPRDAVRVFYGTGLDLLVIGQFVLRK